MNPPDNFKPSKPFRASCQYDVNIIGPVDLDTACAIAVSAAVVCKANRALFQLAAAPLLRSTYRRMSVMRDFRKMEVMRHAFKTALRSKLD